MGDIHRPLLRPAYPARSVRPSARRGGVAARRLTVALLASLVLLLNSASASADTVGLEQYAARLRDARALLAMARGAAPTSRVDPVARARALLTPTTGVGTADATIPLDDRRLIALIDTSDASLDRAIADIDRTLVFVETALRPRSGAEADARVRELLADREGRSTSLALFALLANLFTYLFGWVRLPDLTPLTSVPAAVGSAIALVLVVVLVRGVRERIRREVVLPELGSGGATDPALHLRVAEDALARGRAREAIHALYLYAFAALDARHALAYDPALTDRELLARAATISQVDSLRELLALHERVWFGLREPLAEEPSRARQLALRVLR